MTKDSQQRISQFREEVINKSLVVSCILAIVTYFLSLLQFFNSGFEVSFVTDFIVVLVISLVTVYRKKLDIKLKSTIILIGIFAVVMVDIYEIGILSANKVLLILIPFFAFISLSAKRTFLYLIITFLGFTILAILHITGILKPIPYKELGFVAWGINLLLILLVASVIVFIVSRFNNEYENLIRDLKNQNDALQEKERILAKYRDELEEKVKTRTRELNQSNEVLKKQKKELSETIQNLHKTKEELVQTEKNAALSSLSSGLAHELNNPLNFIRGGVEVLDIFVKNNLTEPQIKDFEKLVNGIKEGVSRSAKIVEGLNQYNSVVEKNENCNINSILNNSIAMLQKQMAGRIDVVKNLDVGLPELWGDKYQFYQLFLNLIQNSIDAIEDTGTIIVSTSSKNSTVYIKIEDSGAGVAKSKIKRLFDPFYTTKEIGKGTGLGLFICSAIVKNHDGSLEFESEVHNGSTVSITFPVISQPHVPTLKVS